MNEILNVKGIHRNGSPEVKVGIRDKFFILGRDENDYLRLVDEKGESIAIEAELQLKDGSHVEDHIGQGGDDLVSPDNTVNGHNLRSDITLSFEDLEWDSNIDESMISDVVPISRGGTGADNAADALRNLTLKNGDPTDARHTIHALSTAEVQDKLDNYKPSELLAIEKGGTGADTVTEAWENLTDFEFNSTVDTKNMPASRPWRGIAYGSNVFTTVANSSQYGAYSTDGISWTQSTLPASRSWTEVEWVNNKFIAITMDNNTYGAYSNDGITWTQMNIGISYQCGIAYGNGKFIILKFNSTQYAYSTDGISWSTGSNLPRTNDWSSVCYGNGKFVAVANTGNSSSYYGAYSIDGTSWTEMTISSSTYGWNHIIYANNKFIAIASSAIYYSIDGLKWTLANNDTHRSSWWALCYNCGMYFVIAQDREFAYSKDGISWKILVRDDLDYSYGIASDNNVFIVTKGVSGSTGYNTCYYIPTFGTAGARSTLNAASTSELTELVNNKKFTLDTFQEAINGLAPEYDQEVTLSGGKLHNSVCWGNDRFVIISSHNNGMSTDGKYAAYSYDGIKWKQTTMPSGRDWGCVCYGNDRFVAVCDQNGSQYGAYSLDGITWIQMTISSSTIILYSICWGKDKFIAVGARSKYVYSTNGITWTEGTMPTTDNGSWSQICYGNDRFVAVCNYDNKVAYSTTGASWTLVNLLTDWTAWTGIAHGNNTFVVIGNNSELTEKCAYSTNGGLTWTATSMPDEVGRWNSICYGNGLFIAIGPNTQYGAYSFDGITWFSFKTSDYTSVYWNSIACGKDRFVMVPRDSQSGSVILSGPSLARKLLNTVSKSEIYGMVAAKKWS